MEIRPIFSALLRNKTAPLLVAIQVAISLAILTNSLYIVNIRQAVSARPSGIADESSVFRLAINTVNKMNFNENIAQQQRAHQILKGIPGVLSVAATNQVPMSRSGGTTGVASDRKQAQGTPASNYFTSDSLINTLGLKLLEGRDFTPDDVLETDPSVSDASAKVVIITQELAKLLYPDTGSVVGKPMYFGTGDDAEEVRIIGVVERLQTIGAQAGIRGEYSTILPERRDFAQYLVRTEPGQRDRIIKEAEAAMRKIGPGAVSIKIKTIESDRNSRYRADKALAGLLIVVSALLLLVTTSGIVGMTTLWVAQRRKQIGVRRALGARKIDILRYFITENILITTGGIASGLLLAIALNQLLVSQLELAKLPVSYMLTGAAIFWLLGIFAVYGPALRAASISPATATRSA
ncbi:ABC transporter permease [Undibacterium terreum]|uniref:ABC transporter permease n=1 Tax=Undibacterium terreum TaxID=1224302 RepID=A0A916XEN5_9BURK|nr:FtsX-like permease family protein [Undibacterium terreum]GGC67929.1 ABC transporter permease [Undibacterium terreum]